MKYKNLIASAIHSIGKAMEWIMRALFTICGLAAIAFVVVITVYLIISGLPAIQEIGLIPFLTGTVWKPAQDQFGILPVILTSVYGTFGAIVIGVPVGLLFAIFLGKMAPSPHIRFLAPQWICWPAFLPLSMVWWV